MTNKSQSTINRKRLDQKVRDMEETYIEAFTLVAQERDQDRQDFKLLAEIFAGIAKIEALQQKLVIARRDRDHYASELVANSITVELAATPPWWSRLFRKGK